MNTASGNRQVLKQRSFACISPPEFFGPRQVQLDEATLRRALYALDSMNPWYIATSPLGRPIYLPFAIMNELLWIFYERYDPATSEGLNSHLQVRLLRPPRHGETLTVAGSFTSKYVRRGRGYVVLEAAARRADGTPVLTIRSGEALTTVDGPDSADAEVPFDWPVPAIPADARGISSSITRKSNEYQLFPRIVQPSQVATFSWIDRGLDSIHTSRSKAQSAGFGATVVQASQLAGLISEELTNLYGLSWVTGGQLDLKFIKPTLAGNPITLGLGAPQVQAGLTSTAVWVAGDTDDLVAAGWARTNTNADTDTDKERTHE